MAINTRRNTYAATAAIAVILAAILLVLLGVARWQNQWPFSARGGDVALSGGQSILALPNPDAPAANPGPVSPASENTGIAVLDPDIYRVPGVVYPRGLNFVFLADGYLSWQEFDQDVELIMRSMTKIEPWRSYERYNVYKIRSKELDICSVKVGDERKPVLRCGAEGVGRYLGNLRMDYFKLIVLSRRSFQSWANVARLDSSGIFFSLPLSARDSTSEETIHFLFLHLLGHAFGLKDEEYFVLAKAHSAAHQPDGPNCAPDRNTAEEWWGDLVGVEPGVGYFKTCSANNNYIKPTKGSIMNLNELEYFTPTYGPVSERYLRKVLDYCFSEKVYSVRDDPDFFEVYPEFGSCVLR